jgi:hypothetical protein
LSRLTTALYLPRLRPDQSAILSHPARFKWICAGRRYGKTVLGSDIVLPVANAGGRAAWFAPEYRNTRALWRAAKLATLDAVALGMVRVNESDHIMEFVRTKGFLAIYSGDNADAARGEAFHVVVVDEAARIKPDVWTDTILSTLADYNGDGINISTPRGRNWYYYECMAAKADGVVSAYWTAPTFANPLPNIQQFAHMARERMPDRTYRQEILAEFIEDGGGVFRKVTDAATAQRQDKAIADHAYAFGVDWGKSNDFTVIAVFDLTIKALVALDRSNQVDYTVQLGRLQALCERFKPTTIIAESNSMGEPLIEQLQRLNLPVQPFTTTNATKTAAIDALALAFERSDLTIINDPVLIAELQAYEMERLPSGLMRYSAPEGMHDDTVMAAAMGWQAATGIAPEDMVAFVG